MIEYINSLTTIAVGTYFIAASIWGYPHISLFLQDNETSGMKTMLIALCVIGVVMFTSGILDFIEIAEKL